MRQLEDTQPLGESGIYSRRMKELVGRRVQVFLPNGKCLRGKLIEFDNQVIVLDHALAGVEPLVFLNFVTTIMLETQREALD